MFFSLSLSRRLHWLWGVFFFFLSLIELTEISLAAGSVWFFLSLVELTFYWLSLAAWSVCLFLSLVEMTEISLAAGECGFLFSLSR